MSGFRQKQVTRACNHQKNYAPAAAAAAAWSFLPMARPLYRKEAPLLADANDGQALAKSQILAIQLSQNYSKKRIHFRG